MEVLEYRRTGSFLFMAWRFRRVPVAAELYARLTWWAVGSLLFDLQAVWRASWVRAPSRG